MQYSAFRLYILVYNNALANNISIMKILCLSKTGNIHEEVEMDVGTDPLQKEDLKEFTNSQEEEPTKTEPITITRGRRRPSGKPCGDHEKVRNPKNTIIKTEVCKLFVHKEVLENNLV